MPDAYVKAIIRFHDRLQFVACNREDAPTGMRSVCNLRITLRPAIWNRARIIPNSLSLTGGARKL